MTLQTIRNLARCVTPARAANLAKVYASFKLSTLQRKPVVWGEPFTLTIEPTNRCNLQCPECPSGNGEMVRPLGIMEYTDFTRIVDEISARTFYLQMFFQGEPFINNKLLDMVRYARQKRMYVAISTNAHYIRQEIADKIVASGLDRLIVSIDGLTEESYRSYRVGGSLKKVHDALWYLQDARRAAGSNMEVVLQFLVSKQNEHEIPELHKLAEKYNTTVALKTMQVYSIESAEHFLPKDERYRRYTIEGGELKPKSRMKNQCVRLWERSVITWDGVVVPCCFDKNAEHPLGNVAERPFSEIWHNGAYTSFRNRILENRRGVPMCTNCTEGLKVYR